MKAGRGEHIALQLNKLKTLGQDESLVVRRSIKAHSIANVTTINPESEALVSSKIKASLPIFFLHNSELPETEVCFSSSRPRKIEGRVDRKLELEPFLSAISAYRYQA